jgi:pantoate--beta-alanine ligase
MTVSSPVTIVRTKKELRVQVAQWRAAGETIALVPTMGALHDGHMALIDRARELASKVCVSLFVNPAQFGKNEDLGTYPRNEDRDAGMLADAGVELLYAPDVTQMYPPDDVTRVSAGHLGDCLEGLSRPGFFTGVATVVTKLLLQCLPDYALFGEKDFQQLQVINRLVKDLAIPVTIEGVACYRENDGLALSSRNIYLDKDERLIAPALYKAMKQMALAMRGGDTAQHSSQAAQAFLIDAGFTSVDYLVACDAETLSEIRLLADLDHKPGRILVAARLGTTRLIDNLELVI